jgi:hypothetical protein
MTSDSSVVPLRQPDAVDDPLTAVLREGARRLLAQAVEAEAEAFLASIRDARLADGRERMVRHGHGPERVIQTGIGPVEVRRVKLRDRDAGESGKRVRFTSALLPRWSRRTCSLDALLPILSTGCGFLISDALSRRSAKRVQKTATVSQTLSVFAPRNDIPSAHGRAKSHRVINRKSDGRLILAELP